MVDRKSSVWIFTGGLCVRVDTHGCLRNCDVTFVDKCKARPFHSSHVLNPPLDKDAEKVPCHPPRTVIYASSFNTLSAAENSGHCVRSAALADEAGKPGVKQRPWRPLAASDSRKRNTLGSKYVRLFQFVLSCNLAFYNNSSDLAFLHLFSPFSECLQLRGM